MSKVSIVLEPEQAKAVEKALDVYLRLCIGQFDILTELVRDGIIPDGGFRGVSSGKIGPRNPASRETCLDFADHIKSLKSLMGYPSNGSNGIGHPHIHDSARRCYEIVKVLTRSLAIQRDPNPKFCGVNYDGLILRLTSDPEPVVLVSDDSDNDTQQADMPAFIGEALEALRKQQMQDSSSEDSSSEDASCPDSSGDHISGPCSPASGIAERGASKFPFDIRDLVSAVQLSLVEAGQAASQGAVFHGVDWESLRIADIEHRCSLLRPEEPECLITIDGCHLHSGLSHFISERLDTVRFPGVRIASAARSIEDVGTVDEIDAPGL
jgi:hypothetical protein